MGGEGDKGLTAEQAGSEDIYSVQAFVILDDEELAKLTSEELKQLNSKYLDYKERVLTEEARTAELDRKTTEFLQQLLKDQSQNLKSELIESIGATVVLLQENGFRQCECAYVAFLNARENHQTINDYGELEKLEAQKRKLQRTKKQQEEALLKKLEEKTSGGLSNTKEQERVIELKRKLTTQNENAPAEDEGRESNEQKRIEILQLKTAIRLRETRERYTEVAGRCAQLQLLKQEIDLLVETGYKPCPLEGS